MVKSELCEFKINEIKKEGKEKGKKTYNKKQYHYMQDKIIY